MRRIGTNVCAAQPHGVGSVARGGKLASAALPLESGGDLLGSMGVVFAAPVAFDDEQRAFLLAFARESAQALQRARLYEAERDARLAAQRSEEAARRAMELEEHGTPRSPVYASICDEDGEVVLRVHNEGPPVPLELQSAMFEPFRRGTSDDEGGSLGLGLFIVREVARAHAGAIEVRSTEEDGTTFTVRLPWGSRAFARGPSEGDLVGP